MLTITRRKDQFVVLTDTTTGREIGRIHQGKISRGGSRLIFEFPRHIRISRGELVQKASPAA